MSKIGALVLAIQELTGKDVSELTSEEINKLLRELKCQQN